MKKIIIDTNAWMAIDEFKIDVFSELSKVCDFPFKLIITEGIIKELNKIIQEQKGKYKRSAKLALDIINKKKIKKIASTLDVDTELAKLSKQGYLILTQDIGLKRRLTKPYLTIRQKKKVMII